MSTKSKLSVRKVFRHTHDPIWQLQFGVIVVMILQFFTGDSYLPVNKFIIIAIEAVLLIALAVATSEGYSRVSKVRRFLALLLVCIVAAINTFSLILLVQELIFSDVKGTNGHALLLSGLAIYVTNIFMFALLYWEMDGGGPDRRVAEEKKRDFVFPQMLHSNISGPLWLPGFIDYLYLSATNVTNFASADTVPVSHRAKLIMMIQALVSVVTVVLVAARAIGVLE
jgi:hypothetical protein